MKRDAEALEGVESVKSRLTLESLAPHFHLPLNDAADQLGLSLTALKRICRHLGLSRWPHRQLCSLDTDIAELRAKIDRHAARQGSGAGPSDSDSARLQVLLKKRGLIVRGAVEGVEVAVRSAIYHADVGDVDEDALFESGTCSKLAQALRGVKRRKGMQGKSLAGFVNAMRSGKPLSPELAVPGYRDPNGSGSGCGSGSASSASSPAAAATAAAKPGAGRRARPTQEVAGVATAAHAQPLLLPLSSLSQRVAKPPRQQQLSRAKAVPRPQRKSRQPALQDGEAPRGSLTIQRGEKQPQPRVVSEQQLGTAQDHRAGGGRNESDTDDDWLPHSAGTSAAKAAAAKRRIAVDIKGAAAAAAVAAAAAQTDEQAGTEDSREGPKEVYSESAAFQPLLPGQPCRPCELDVVGALDSSTPQGQAPAHALLLEQAAVPYDLLLDGPLTASLCQLPSRASSVSSVDTVDNSWALASSDDGGSAFGADAWEDVADSGVVEESLAEEELLFAEFLGAADEYASGAGLESWLG